VQPLKHSAAASKAQAVGRLGALGQDFMLDGFRKEAGAANKTL
jgi:hypothetical protein